MKSGALKNLFWHIGTFIQKNTPAILTGVSVAGVITTTITAVKVTPQVMHAIEDAEMDKDDILTKKEMLKVATPYYVPSLLIGTATIACILGLNSVHTRRNAALASLYTLTDSTLKEYQEKIIEEIGPKKAQKIEDAVAEEKMKKNPVSKNEVFLTGTGDTLCYDVMSGRYFRSEIESIRQGQNDFNYKLINGHSIWLSVNDLYYDLGLKPIRLGDYMGWTTEELLDIRFTSKIADNGDPCVVLQYVVEPRFQYS